MGGEIGFLGVELELGVMKCEVTQGYQNVLKKYQNKFI